MKKTESLFIGGSIIFAMAILCAGLLAPSKTADVRGVHGGKYGAFLAAQHAIYVNDFDAASDFGAELDANAADVVKNTKVMAEFLSGRLPEDAENLSKESGTASRLVYDAYLVEQGDWEKLYARHKNDKSALAAPLRIISSVAIDHRTEAIKFVDSLQTNESWKSFVRGQIYAETGNIQKAAKEFLDVRVDFMNINDYFYIMSFYRHNDMSNEAKLLHDEFTSRPGGMFMLDFDDIPDWSVFSGYKNALAFSLLQSVSHTQVMMFSDLSILLLRFAQIITPDVKDNSAINYYIGQYLFNNSGDYSDYFSRIDSSSPFYLFAALRECEGSGDITKLRHVLRINPLFVPAINKLVSYYVANGDKSAALRVLRRAMNNEKLSDVSHAFLLKSRANVYFAFDDLNNAQSDIHAASDVFGMDSEILALQSKIWARQNREIETAYEYAMTLVKRNPSDVFAWDVLGRVVAVREGDDAALELIERVGELAKECSSLFENLGDLYARMGNTQMAYDSYIRAIDLSDDGLVVVPKIQKKIRKLK